MALSDEELVAVSDGVWSAWADAGSPEPVPVIEARALRAVAEAALAEFAREVMEQ